MCSLLGNDCVIFVSQDVICQEIAALFYLSAAVLEAFATYTFSFLPLEYLYQYQENIAAVVSAWQVGEGR